MVHATSIIGNAMDFIKQYPSFTFEDYFWRYSSAMIRIMSCDATFTRYLSEKQAKKYWANKRNGNKFYDDPNKFMNDLGLPIF